MDFPGYNIVLENTHPAVELEDTRILLNGENVTDRIVDMVVDINAVDDVVSAYITVYKNHWFRRDEVITHTII